MSALDNSLNELRRVHKKFDLEGSFETNRQANAKWPKTLAHSAETDYFYDNCEPVDVEIETGTTPICFFDLSKIEDAQVGYKWMGDSNKTEINEDWLDYYLVLMDDIGGGKPIIAITSTIGTPVWASYDAVDPFKIADTLADFFLAFAKLIEIVHGEYDIFGIYNDDDTLSTAFRERLIEEVSPLLGTENFERFFDYFYG